MHPSEEFIQEAHSILHLPNPFFGKDIPMLDTSYFIKDKPIYEQDQSIKPQEKSSPKLVQPQEPNDILISQVVEQKKEVLNQENLDNCEIITNLFNELPPFVRDEGNET